MATHRSDRTVAVKNKPKTRKDKSRKNRQRIPDFATFVSPNAGLAATGVRVGFPAQRTVSMNYCTFVEMASTSGSIAVYQFRLNSAFDPDYTAAGSQPLGFDQWSAYYNHYVVETCDYQVQLGPRQALDTSTAGQPVMQYATHLSDDATIPTSYAELLQLGAAGHMWNNGTPFHIFKGSVNVAKFMNRPDPATDSELRALVTANPSEQIFLSIRGSPADQGSTVTTSIVVKLTMRVRFMEPKDLTPSVKSHTTAGDDEYEFVRVKKVTK